MNDTLTIAERIEDFENKGIGLLKKKLIWALNPLPNGLVKTSLDTKPQKYLTRKSITENAKKKEREWGNKVINQLSNTQWTTLLGEGLVNLILKLNNLNPRKPNKVNACPFEVDWETDTCMWEVKTRSWTTQGTAGEKVFGTMYKYADIPVIYDKPLKIVVVAYQEYELTHGNTKIFNTDSARQNQMLDFAKSCGVEYVKFSDIVFGNVSL